MAFEHAPAGGNGNLVVTSLQSPNFNALTNTGWQIKKDGSATFNSVSLPGVALGAKVTFASTAPSSPAIGDLWYDTSHGLILSQWNGSIWAQHQYGTNAIAANAITAGQIVAGAIDGQVINGVTINGATINATSGGVFVYSGTGTVLNANPNFATGITNWTATGGSISYTTPTLNSHNTMKLLLSTFSPPPDNVYSGFVASEFEPVTAGNMYAATFQIQLSSASYAELGVIWYNGAGTQLSNVIVATPSGTSAVWSTYTGVVTAPAGATQMKVYVLGQASVGSAGTSFVNVGQAQLATKPSLINSVAPVSGTDSQGNAYLIGIATYGTNGSYAQLASNGTFPALIMNPMSATHLTTFPQVFASDTNAGLVNEFNNIVITSGKSTNHDDAAIQLFGASADNTLAATAVIEFGGQAVAFISRSGIAANWPGTPNTAEIWHTITLDAGWSTVAGFPAPQYRLTPTGDVQFSGAASHAAFTGTLALNGSNPLATAYRPTNQHVWREGNGGTIADSNLLSSGIINALGYIAGGAATSVRIYLDGIVPLN